MGFLRKSFPYLAAFFVMLLGSGLVKIPTDSLWFYVIRYGIILGVLGIGVWTWYKARANKIPPTEYLLLSIFVPFTNDYMLHIIFVIFTVVLFWKEVLLPFKSPLKPIYILFFMGLASYIINQFIEFNPLSFPIFFILFFLPFAFFSLFYKYTNVNNRAELIEFYLKLVLIMSLVIIIQTIVFWNEHPDARNGGTTHVHFAGVLLTLAFIICLSKLTDTHHSFKNLSIYEKLILIITLPLLFLMDAKLSLGIVVFIIVIALFLMLRKKVYRISAAAVVLSIVVILFLMPQMNLPISILSFKNEDISIINIVNRFKGSEKMQIIKHAAALPFDEPLTFIIGSGPGTFLSRTSLLKKYMADGHTYSLYSAKDSVGSSTLNKLFAPADTRLEKRYNFAEIKGNNNLGVFYDWKSSMLSFYFEFGVISILTVIYFLYKLFKKVLNKENRVNYNYILLGFLMLFIIAISFFNYWQEYTNYVIIQNSLLGFIQLNKINQL